MNWLDVVLIILFALNILSGWKSGLIGGLAELLSLIVALIAAVTALPFVSGVFRSMGFSENFALFFGFGFVFVVIQIALAIATLPLTKRLKRRLKDTLLGAVNHWLGPLPKIAMFFISTSFLLAAFLVFPIYPPFKSAIANSRFGLQVAAPAVTVLEPISIEFKHETKSPAV